MNFFVGTVRECQGSSRGPRRFSPIVRQHDELGADSERKEGTKCLRRRKWPCALSLSQVRTCPAAMGYSFAAGTTDGPGAFDFIQGQTFARETFICSIEWLYTGDSNKSNPFWNAVRNLIHTPSQLQVDCQAPKPVLLDTGEVRKNDEATSREVRAPFFFSFRRRLPTLGRRTSSTRSFFAGDSSS